MATIKKTTEISTPDVDEVEKKRVETWEKAAEADEVYQAKLKRNASIKEKEGDIELLDQEILDKKAVVENNKKLEKKNEELKLDIFNQKEILNQLKRDGEKVKTSILTEVEAEKLKLEDVKKEVEQIDKDKEIAATKLQEQKEVITKQEKIITDNEEFVKQSALNATMAAEKCAAEEKKLQAVKDSIEKEEAEVERLKSEGRELGAKNKEAQEKLDQKMQDIVSKIPEERVVFEAEMKKREAGNSAKEADLVQREGWMEEKRQALKTVKEELEKHFNRKFNNIII